MKNLLFIFAVYFLVNSQLAYVGASPYDDVIDVNGGMACAACTVMVGLVEQVAEVNNKTVTDMVSQLCTFFPGEYTIFCDILVHFWGPAIIEKLNKRETPDVVCYSLGVCHVDPGMSYCHLFPIPRGGMEYAVQESRRDSKVPLFFHWTLVENLQSACELPGVSQVCKNIQSAFNNMKPFLDLDKDKFSIIETFRGNSWRGRDCDDIRGDIYPGRKPMDQDIVMDSNCNGIFGVNSSSGIPYEEALCQGTNPRSLIYFGDSVASHFHVPEQWLNPAEISMEILQNFSFVIGNEFDWPQASFSTGYENVTWPIVSGYTDSVYLRLRERNLCNHRDYQNICFNGAASDTMLEYLVSVARNAEVDKPALVFFSLMGNDVCNRYMSSPDDLRTPEEFRKNVIKSLNILSEMLPNRSHVILTGLVDGSFVYGTMKDLLHPLGLLHKDVYYSDIYEWFNCMRIGPCYGWMNKNETFRNATSKRAEELTDVLRDIAANVKYDAFDIHFLSNPLRKVLEQWKEEGRELWQFLEPVDSLHPVQEVLPLVTQTVWEEILEKYPHVLGDINPNNHLIKEIFGDQGGH